MQLNSKYVAVMFIKKLLHTILEYVEQCVYYQGERSEQLSLT